MRTALVACAASLIAIGTARCGSVAMSPSSTDAGSGSGGGQVDAGTGGGQTDAGSGGGDGPIDAGGGGGGGQIDAGGGGGGDSGGGGGGSGGGGGGGNADAGSGGGGGGGDQPDAGTGGGGTGTEDECAGLGPDAVGAPSATAGLFAGRYDSCSVGSTDGSGTVALMLDSRFQGPPDQFTIHLFDPSGTKRGTYSGYDTVLIEELAGFELRNWDLQKGELVAIDENGSVMATTGRIDEKPWWIANDPLGGIVVISLNTDNTPLNAVAAYDDHLNLRWRTQLSSRKFPLALGTDRQGNSLVLFDAGSGKVSGIWIDHAGNAGAEFQALESVDSRAPLHLTPRVQDGLLLQGGLGGPWIRQFDPMGTGSPPPDWLRARPGTTLHMARNGRAYAVIHPATGDSSCHADIEVIATTGKVCGTAVFPADGQAPNCTGALTVGYDGTVVQQLGWTFYNDGTSNHTCNFRWWTGFLH